MTVPDPHDVEAALDSVPGVAGASVVLGGAGGELRLVLAPGADEGTVAPAVHQVLRDRFGLGLDPRRLSVMEESDPEPAPPHLRLVPDPELGPAEATSPLDLVSPPRLSPEMRPSAGRHPAASVRRGGRATLDRLAVATDGLGAEVTVSLVLDGTVLAASARSASTASAVLRAVGSATADAVRQACGEQVRVDVDDVRIVPLGDHEAAVVSVLWSSEQGAERCIGASEVREDPRQAVIRATLDAVNRRLALA